MTIHRLSYLSVLVLLLMWCGTWLGCADDPAMNHYPSSAAPSTDYLELARSSMEYEQVRERVSSNWPGFTVDSAGFTIHDDLFGEGELVGVYFPIADGSSSVGFVSLWYNPNTATFERSILGLSQGKDQDSLYLEEDGEPIAATDSFSSTHEETSESGKAANKASCLNACKGSVGARNAFCRGIPHPYVRAGCWAIVYAGYAACAGFCYWHF